MTASPPASSNAARNRTRIAVLRDIVALTNQRLWCFISHAAVENTVQKAVPRTMRGVAADESNGMSPSSTHRSGGSSETILFCLWTPFPDRKFNGAFDRRLQQARVETRTHLYCS